MLKTSILATIALVLAAIAGVELFLLAQHWEQRNEETLSLSEANTQGEKSVAEKPVTSQTTVSETNKNREITETPVREKTPEETPSTAAGSEKFNFRNTYWGMSREELKATLPESFSEEFIDGFHYYDEDYLGFPAGISYVFDRNQLIKIICEIGELVDLPYTRLREARYTSLQELKRDVKYIKETLAAKYGEPVQDDLKENYTSYFKYDPSFEALGDGFTSFIDYDLNTVWETLDTRIDLVVKVVNSQYYLEKDGFFSPRFDIIYNSKTGIKTKTGIDDF